jgi:hypothetical protein
MSELERPSALGRVRGVRQFRITKYGYHEGMLTGLFFRTIWNPRINQATCPSVARNAEQALGWADLEESCTCGFYANLDSPPVADLGCVIGIIEGWGNTVIGEDGFRCERAKIVALVIGRVLGKRFTYLALSIASFLFVTGWAFIIDAFSLSPRVPLISYILITFSLLGMIFIASFPFHAHRYRNLAISVRGRYIDPELAKKVKERYPNIEVFHSLKKAKRKYPLGRVRE